MLFVVQETIQTKICIYNLLKTFHLIESSDVTAGIGSCCEINKMKITCRTKLWLSDMIYFTAGITVRHNELEQRSHKQQGPELPASIKSSKMRGGMLI